jgi:hypothetical protein
MPENLNFSNDVSLEDRLHAELTHIRQLGANQNLTFAASNLSAYEALLLIMQSGDKGIPVYEAIAGVRTHFSGKAGILNRLNAMRSMGLIEEKLGRKKSQVCLAPSDRLIFEFESMTYFRHYGDFPK